jgi:hypothetical protein
MADAKAAPPTWLDVRKVLRTFDRAGLQGLIQDLYAASKSNRAFLHARLGLGSNQLGPYRARISRWIYPDLKRNQFISVSKAKKAIAQFKKAIGRPDGLAELSIFYCERALDFLEGCAMEDEGYFAALIRMYDQSVQIVSDLPPTERFNYVERLDKLRSRAKSVGHGVEDVLNDLWHNSELVELPDE